MYINRLKAQLTPKMVHLMFMEGKQCSENQPQAASGHRNSIWLQAVVMMTTTMRGMLVKKYSRQGLAMLKASIVTTQRLFEKTNSTFISSADSENPPLSLQLIIALPIPPFSQQQSGSTNWQMAIIAIWPASCVQKANIICMRLVKENRELRGRYILRSFAVAVQPMKSTKKKLRHRSQQRYCRSAGYCRYFSEITVEVYQMSEQTAIMLNSAKLVASPARHYLISYTIDEMLATCEVKGAEIEAQACERDSPMSACFKAPQSLAPSPHMDTFRSMCWQAITILALSLGLVRAKTEALFIKRVCEGVRSTMRPGNSQLKALPVTHSWQLVDSALSDMASIKRSVFVLSLMMGYQGEIFSALDLAVSSISQLADGGCTGGFCVLISVVQSSSWKLKFSSVNLPLTKSQMSMPLLLSLMLHLQLMFDPVSVLSPVIITHPISAAFSCAMAPRVQGFSLFQNTSNPLKISSFSASVLEILLSWERGRGLLAMARTLKPWEAQSLRISWQFLGMELGAMMVCIISGEPLAQTWQVLVEEMWQTTLIRCRSASNSNLRQTSPLYPRQLLNPKITSGSACDWLRMNLPKRNVLISMGSPINYSVASILMMELLLAMLVRMSVMWGLLDQLCSMRVMLCSLLGMGGLKVPLVAGTRAQKSMKSYVKVPVLSKQQNYIIPPVMTLLWAMQKIFLVSSLSMAQMIPKVMLTGRDGGTVMVIRSKNFCTRSVTLAYSWMRMTSTMKVETESKNRNIRYFDDSLWNMFSCYFGNRIIRISCPLVVTKLVRTTHTGIPQAYRYDSNLDIFFLSFT